MKKGGQSKQGGKKPSPPTVAAAKATPSPASSSSPEKRTAAPLPSATIAAPESSLSPSSTLSCVLVVGRLFFATVASVCLLVLFAACMVMLILYSAAQQPDAGAASQAEMHLSRILDAPLDLGVWAGAGAAAARRIKIAGDGSDSAAVRKALEALGSSGTGSGGGDTLAPPPPPSSSSSSSSPTTTATSQGRTDAGAAGRSDGDGGGGGGGSGGDNASLEGSVCYTLEEYSDAFLRQTASSLAKPLSPAARRATRVFMCGVRVSDLRTEHRKQVRQICGGGSPGDDTKGEGGQNPVSRRRRSGTGVAATAYSTAAAAADADAEAAERAKTAFPHLRIALTGREAAMHAEAAKLDASRQIVLLDRVNDDYCDCIDGSDEPLTAACSMSGAGTPGLIARWQDHLRSARASSRRLYDDPDEAETRAMQGRHAEKGGGGGGGGIVAQMAGVVQGTLAAMTGGVVSAVACAGDPTILLPPSRVGDGVVDCPDGSDEAFLASAAAAGDGNAGGGSAASAPSSSSSSGAKKSGHTTTTTAAALAEARRAEVERYVLQPWRERQARMRGLLSSATLREGAATDESGGRPGTNADASTAATTTAAAAASEEKGVGVNVSSLFMFNDPLYPQHYSLASLLLDKQYHALFEPRQHRRQARRNAAALYSVYKKGNAIYQERRRRGWEAIGIPTRDKMQRQLGEFADVQAQLRQLTEYISGRVRHFRVQNPLEAGVSREELEHHMHLKMRLEALQRDIQFALLVSEQHAFGPHYEYYPLATQPLMVSPGDAAVRRTPVGDDMNSPGLLEKKRKRELPMREVRRRLLQSARRGDGGDSGDGGDGNGNAAAAAALHLDNYSLSHYGLVYIQLMPALQNISDDDDVRDAAEALSLPGARTLPPEELRAALQAVPPHQTGQMVLLGQWQPFSTRHAVDHQFGVLDPSGEVLARRAMVSAGSVFALGGGRGAWSPHVVSGVEIARRGGGGNDGKKETSSAERLREKQKELEKGAEEGGGGGNDNGGSSKKRLEIPLVPQSNAPHVLALHRYSHGGVPCDADAPPPHFPRNDVDDADDFPLEHYYDRFQDAEAESGGKAAEDGANSKEAEEAKEKERRERARARRRRFGVSRRRQVAGNVVHVCAAEDGVLAWAWNGKCTAEVVVGTPSACSDWALEEARRRLRQYGHSD